MDSIPSEIFDGAYPSVPTTNNMQADSHETPETQEELTIAPGPGIFYWRKVVPNSVTILATVVGLSAFRLGLDGNYQLGVLAILGAGILDGLDGPIARALHGLSSDASIFPDFFSTGTSRFGAELDSLSDYVNFGVSPSLLLYFWCLQRAGWAGWAVCLCYTVCMGCRLARFNAGVDFNASSVTKSFFMGVPAPAGAMLVMLPLVCSFQFGDSLSFVRDPFYVSPYIIFVAFMLVSRVPTFSSKMINRSAIGKLNFAKIVVFISAAVVTAYLFLSHLWLSLLIVSILYIASFPMSYGALKYLQAKQTKQDKKKQ